MPRSTSRRYASPERGDGVLRPVGARRGRQLLPLLVVPLFAAVAHAIRRSPRSRRRSSKATTSTPRRGPRFCRSRRCAPVRRTCSPCSTQAPRTHVRLNIFPDGGGAQLRVYGEAESATTPRDGRAAAVRPSRDGQAQPITLAPPTPAAAPPRPRASRRCRSAARRSPAPGSRSRTAGRGSCRRAAACIRPRRGRSP
ncbi:MAG: hypothetical protein KDB80_01660 [Planctomycetes bacterium]|nr:hypothetical protein [Planctomycetota bacterium]